MFSLFTKTRIYSIHEFCEYSSLNKGQKFVYDIAKDFDMAGIVLDKKSRTFNFLAVSLAILTYSDKVFAATGTGSIEPGYWKLIGIIQKIVAGLALLYSYRTLAKMAAKGEGTWKEVGYGLLIVAADYGLPAAFKFVEGLF